MCETKCSLIILKNPRALCRLSITDGTTGRVLVDSDHRTWVNGITTRHLSGVTFTLQHAQSILGTLLTCETVVRNRRRMRYRTGYARDRVSVKRVMSG